MPNPSVDRWIQRAAVAAMVTLALTLVGVGVALYGTPAKTSSHDGAGIVAGK